MLKGRIKNVAHVALVRLAYSLTCETCELLMSQQKSYTFNVLMENNEWPSPLK